MPPARPEAVTETVEPISDIIENDRGEWLVVIPRQPEPADHPVLLVDAGAGQAVLVRSDHQRVRLTGLHPAALAGLAKVREVLIAETEAGAMVAGYPALIGGIDRPGSVA